MRLKCQGENTWLIHTRREQVLGAVVEFCGSIWANTSLPLLGTEREEMGLKNGMWN